MLIANIQCRLLLRSPYTVFMWQLNILGLYLINGNFNIIDAKVDKIMFSFLISTCLFLRQLNLQLNNICES